MEYKDFIIRNFKEEDADEFFKMYIEEYESYFEFNSSKELSEYALQDNCLSKVIQFRNDILGGYFVSYNPEQRMGYPHGLITKKKYRGTNIYRSFVINPNNFKNLLSSVFKKFCDVDIFYVIARGYSRSANSGFDLMGFKYNGVIPSMHKVGLIREPGIVRILYPQTERSFQEYYNKDLFKKWTLPKIIPELKELSETVIEFLKLKTNQTPKVANIQVKQKNETIKCEILQIKKNVISYKFGKNRVITITNVEDRSSRLEFTSNNASILSNLVSIALQDLDNLDIIDIISVDVSSLKEQRIFYDLGFRPVAYMPLLKYNKGRRYDVFSFIKLKNSKDLLKQYSKILKIQRGYKIKKIVKCIFKNFEETDNNN